MDPKDVLSDEERRRLIDSIPKIIDADACKENIQPRRQGRSATALLSLYDTSPSEREALLEAGHLKFQEQIDNLEEQDDPLQIYLNYIEWTIQMYPQGQSVDSNLLGLLKDATDKFKNDRRYKYDPRYLKIWMEYVNWVTEPKEIFLFLMKQGIGQTLTLFYEEYASFYEKQNKFNEAMQVYELGIKENADPIRRLEKSFESFKARAEEKKKRGLVQKKQKQANVQMESLRSSGQRIMLGQKFDSQSRSSFAANVFNSIESRSGGPSNSSSNSNTSLIQRTRSFGNDRPTSSTTPSFSVFVEPETNNSSILPSSSSSHRSQSFNITPSSRIENQKPVERFSGATLPQKRSLVQLPPEETFEVYQDPEEEHQEEYQPSSFGRSSSMLSIMSTDSESALSRLRRNPLAEEHIHKRLRVSEAQKILEARFEKNQHRYVISTLSNGRTEVIAVSKDHDPELSFEEIRFNAMKKESKSKEESTSEGKEGDGFSCYFEKEEAEVAPELTTETLAAMKSIGGLFEERAKDTKEEEEDLTWNNSYQNFKPIRRQHTNENL